MILAASILAAAWLLSWVSIAVALVLMTRAQLERTDRVELAKLREHIEHVEREYVDATKRASFGRGGR